jgi:hypothetical protein
VTQLKRGRGSVPHTSPMRRTLGFILLLAVSAPLMAASQGGRLPVPLPLFPPNSWWNIDVSQAPLDTSSAAFISFIGVNQSLHPDFGGDAGDGTIYGIPFIQVDGAQAKRAVSFYYSEQSDGIDHETDEPFPFYPIPDEAITQPGWIEGGPPGNVDEDGDRHILIVDTTNNHLYELYDMLYSDGAWSGGSGAFFDMSTNDRRPEGWTSADAAGLAMLPGLVRYDEVYDPGEIRHALRVTVRATNGHVYPASHTAGDTIGALPMGARLRLKAGVDISGFDPAVQKIFRAMKKYGLIVADNGTDMYISGAYDTRWDNDILNPAFDELTAGDFEVVQRGWRPPVTLVVSMPDPMGAGDAAGVTVTAYGPDYEIATGYTGTIHFSSTDALATLPSNYTFTAGDAGTHAFAGGVTLRTAGPQIVTVSDVVQPVVTGSVQVMVGPAAPSSLSAIAVSTTQVNLSWAGVPGAEHYEILRATAAGSLTPIGTSFTTSFTDLDVVANTSYLYRVRTVDASSRLSPVSAPEVATTVVFTNDPLAAGVTTIKAVHVTELRQAVNSLRALAGLGAFSFTDATLTPATPVKALHVAQLRDAVAPARAALSLPAVDPGSPVVAGTTIVAAIHFEQMRAAVK